MTIDDFVERHWKPGEYRKDNDSHYMVCCPLHTDKTPSMSVSVGDNGGIVMHCFSCGEGAEAVCRHFGMAMSDLMGDGQKQQRKLSPYEESHGVFVCEYIYKDENGVTILAKERRRKTDGTKVFIQKVPSEPGAKFRWDFHVKKMLEARGQKRPLYKLPELLKAVHGGRTIFLCEGEKDVDTLRAHGFAATTTVEGAGGKWADNYTESFDGAKIVLVIPDNDKPPADKHSQGWQGQQCAVMRRDVLRHAGVNVRVFELPAVFLGKPVKDPTDFFDAGGSADTFKDLAQACIDSDTEWVAPWLRPGAAPLPDADASKPKKKRTTSEKAFEKSYNDTSLTVDERCERYADWLEYRITKKDDTIAWAVGMTLACNTVCKDLKAKEADRVKILCRIVVAWLNHTGRLYYHALYRDFASEMYFQNAGKRLWQVDSDWFRSHIAKHTGLNREDTRFRKVMAAIQDEALQGSAAIGVTPEFYWARRGNSTVYVSCGEGRMARIKPGTVEMCDNGTDGVLFPLDKTLTAWEYTSTPRDPFAECCLWRNMETTPEQRLIFKLWALCIPFGFDAKPPLSVTGGPGSGKTAVVNGLFRLLGMDSRTVSVESGDRGETNLWVQLNAGGLILLDNIDINIKWFPNTVEAASTGGTKEAKRLYTDTEIVRLLPRSYIAITSIKSMFAARQALSDRMLHVELQRITGKETKESEIYQEVENIRDDGMTFIVNLISKCLADSRPVPHVNRRHPDFGRAAILIGRALGIEDQAVAAMRAAEIDKYVSNLRADMFGQIFTTIVRTPMEFDSKHFIHMMEQHPAYGRDFVLKEDWTPVRVGKGIERLMESLRFCYKLTKKNRCGLNKYHVEPTDFILAAVTANEETDTPDASPVPLSDTSAINYTPINYATNNGDSDEVFEFE